MVRSQKIKTYKNSRTVLRKLNTYQDKIIVIYRPNTDYGWADRCVYLDENFSHKKAYNHRTMLECEVVIEYDLDNPNHNRLLANRILLKLEEDKIDYGTYKSGNKSTHIHIYLDIPDGVIDIPLLKRIFVLHYGTFYYDKTSNTFYSKEEKPDNIEVQKVTPDLQLCGRGHPIRMEFGLHEKTGKFKTPIKRSKGYLSKNTIKDDILKAYVKEKTRLSKIATSKAINNLKDHPLIQKVLNTVKFQEDIKDGRDRLLFALIHILKPYYEKEDLKKLLVDWYKYCRGTKLTVAQIEGKVDYHWSRNYIITLKYLTQLMEDIGAEID